MTYSDDLRKRTVEMLEGLGVPTTLVSREDWSIVANPDGIAGGYMELKFKVWLSDLDFKKVMTGE